MENNVPNYPETMARTTRIKNSVYKKRIPSRDSYREDLFRSLVNDGCEDFYNYVDWLDLAKSPDVIVLPVTNSFFYIPEDMTNTETVINLKPLNLIKDVRAFLKKIHSFLPEYSYFTGCFDDYSNGTKEESSSIKQRDGMKGKSNKKSALDTFFNAPVLAFVLSKLVDRGFNPGLTRRSATYHLQNAGFTVLDITAFNGRTYFCAQKRPSSDK